MLIQFAKAPAIECTVVHIYCLWLPREYALAHVYHLRIHTRKILTRKTQVTKIMGFGSKINTDDSGYLSPSLDLSLKMEDCDCLSL